jgi:hypothetical protein
MPFEAALGNEAFVPCWDACVTFAHAGMVHLRLAR